MRTKKAYSLLGYIACVLFISFFTLGGCDIEFSSDNDNGNGNGGNGNEEATLQGTITSIIPDRNLDGIRVEVEDEDTGNVFSDEADTNGFFEIEGGFSGTPARLEFLDGQTQIALTNVTVFPGAEIDLGDITIDSGSVTFDDDIIVIFEGDVTENNCSQGVGTVEVTEDNIIVEVDSSTDIIIDGDDLVCEDLLLGDQVEVRGELLINNTVRAELIEVL